MKGLLLALQFLTTLPVPRVHADREDFVLSMRWFPLAGIVVGAVVMGAAWLGMRHDGWTDALLALAAWVLVTGALHLDGLGDIADAAGAAHGDRARLSAVLADPHIGSFGVVAIGMQLLAKLVLLHALLDQHPLWTLPAIPAIARIGPLAWARWLPPLHEGLGSLFRDAVGRRHLLGWSLAASLACAFAPALAAGLIAMPLWAWWLKARIGGISGDGHGAGIELVETALLAALVLVP